MLRNLRKFANEMIQSMTSIREKNSISFGMIPATILGNVWVAISKDGLIAVDFDLDEDEFSKETRKLTGAGALYSNEAIEEIASQVTQYLEGKSTQIDYPVDLSTVSSFQRRVLEEAAKIARGQYVTYGDIARSIGKPNASQAVGQALRWNPVPIVIPCHRVLSADGSLGGYGGRMGSERKIKLLKLEGVILA